MLLFFGMRDMTGGLDALNPGGLRRAGFSGARNMRVGGVDIRVPSQYNMEKAADSPFVFDGKSIRDRIGWGEWEVEAPAVSLAGKQLKTTLPTLSGVVGVMVFPGCVNFDRNVQCQFCIAGGTQGKRQVKPSEVVAELSAIRGAGVPVKSVSLNTGQMASGDEIYAVASCAAAIRKWDEGVTISAEVWPYSVPDSLGWMSGLIDTFMVNMELASDEARRELCPAKPSGREYFRTFERLLKGGFQVSSVLQTNFYMEKEPVGGVVEAVRRMLEMGVIPELLVSRAVKGSAVKDGYFNAETGLAEAVQRFGTYLARMERIAEETGKKVFAASSKAVAGCVRCGMCNINRDFR